MNAPLERPAHPEGPAPLLAPLTYPGLPPDRPAVLVTADDVVGVRPLRAAPPGQWPVDGPGPDTPLDQVLQAAAGPPIGRRAAVLAVGSNASVAQIRRKLGLAARRPLVPIVSATVRGLAVGVSAHVSRAGYLPATPVEDPDAESGLWVLWLDSDSLAVIDKTEPNYRRVRVPGRCPVRLVSGQPVPECWMYVSRHGHLTDRAGRFRELTDQPSLISGLLGDVPSLTGLAGSSPPEWAERVQDPTVREEIRLLFRSAGLVSGRGTPPPATTTRDRW